ncbi:MAG: hypothetical protein AB8G96_04635 [Phycisphaerales bacterium]
MAIDSEILPADPVRWLEIERLLTLDTMQLIHGRRGYILPLESLGDVSGSGGFVSVGGIFPRDDRRTWGLAAASRWMQADHAEMINLVDRHSAAMANIAIQSYADRANASLPPSLLADLQSLRFSRFPVMAVFLPDFGRHLDPVDELRAERDATRIMLAIERFTAAVGQPPAALSELVGDWMPSLPVDTISGQTFGYRRTAMESPAGYVLYSFGPDGVDDGGRFESLDQSSDEAGDHGLTFDASARVEAGFDVPLHGLRWPEPATLESPAP